MYTDSTYAYLAPEQVNHTGSNLKSDVWQLGCCFAKILTRACGGYSAIVKLNDTYKNSKSRHESSIAMQLIHFLAKFQELCASMPDVLKLTCGMLEEDPAMRWTVVRVRKELARVVEECLFQN